MFEENVEENDDLRIENESTNKKTMHWRKDTEKKK